MGLGTLDECLMGKDLGSLGTRHHKGGCAL